MKAVFLLLLIMTTLFCAGCAATDEDKHFYGRGWWQPDTLDHDDDPPTHGNETVDPMYQ
ncbi:MAG: hypothetical protein QM796_09280 [Chthoniobacteraceae bacterium]